MMVFTYRLIEAILERNHFNHSMREGVTMMNPMTKRKEILKYSLKSGQQRPLYNDTFVAQY